MSTNKKSTQNKGKKSMGLNPDDSMVIGGERFNPQLIINSQRKEFNEKFYQKLKHNISEERYQEAKLNQKGLR